MKILKKVHAVNVSFAVFSTLCVLPFLESLALPTPDGKGYCVMDLGLDQIVEYPSGRVFRTSPSGAGPRHLLFHPDGRLAFLVSELGNLVTSLSWSPADGFGVIDTLSTLANANPVNPVNPVLKPIPVI